MNYLLRIFILSLFTLSLAYADSFYSLGGFNKAYLVVEISGKKIPATYKNSILEELKNTTNEVGIDTDGYSGRVIAFLIGEKHLQEKTLINIKLIVGEQVRRIGSEKTIYADTYQNSKSFLYTDDEELEENIEDTVFTMLNGFTEQYKKENTKALTIEFGKEEFAEVLNYETSYDIALKKAKEQKKDIMLVLVTNYCPWCRKFEKNVLAQSELNTLIHKKYIPLVINKEKGGFPKEFNTSFTPVVYFIDHKSKKSYKKIMGYHNRDEFIYTVKNK